MMQAFQQISPVSDPNRNQRMHRVSDIINSKIGSPFPSMGSHFGLAGTSFFKAATQSEKRDFLVFFALERGHEGCILEANNNIEGFLVEEPISYSIRYDALAKTYRYQKDIISYIRRIGHASLLTGNRISTGSDKKNRKFLL